MLPREASTSLIKCTHADAPSYTGWTEKPNMDVENSPLFFDVGHLAIKH